MRALHFVRVAEDGAHILLQSPEGAEDFGLPLDTALRDAVTATAPHSGQNREPAPPAGPATPLPESAPVSAREIQVRVRGGESPEQVAESLGVPLERVMRFAAAVVGERRLIIDEARRARARHPAPDRGDGKPLVFGEAVDSRFHAHGIPAADVTWDAHRRHDGEWVVRARWVAGSGEHEAQWLFHRKSRMVTPADDVATELLSDRPIRPVPVPAAPRLVVAAPPTPEVVAFPPMPEAHTGPIAVVEDVFDQEAQSPVDPDAPLLPLGMAEPEAHPAPAPEPRRPRRRERSDSGRPRVPSWDDIVLGVRRESD